MFILLFVLLLLVLAFLAGYKIKKPGFISGVTVVLLVAILCPTGWIIEGYVYGIPPHDVGAGLLSQIALPFLWVAAIVPAVLAYWIGRYCSPDKKKTSEIMRIQIR